MKAKITLGIVLLCMGSAAFPAYADQHPAVGHWLGMTEGDIASMRYDVEISADGDSLQAVFVLIDEGGVRVPAESAQYKDGTIRVTAMQDAVVLKGEVGDNEIHGSLRLPAGQTATTRLARDGSAQAESMIGKLDERIAKLRGERLELVRTGPAKESVNRDALDQLLAAADASFTTALALMHDGELVGEWYRGEEPVPVQTMSVTKAVMHLVIGRLMHLGLLDSVDVPVHEFYPQWQDDEQRSTITLRHLLAHTSGLHRGQPAIPIYQSDDFVQFALDAPLETEPGTRVIYSNNATNLLGGIVGQLVDASLEEFLADDLFGKLGIEDFSWDTDPAGNPQGMAGLHLRAGDLARLGQLALDRGQWQGEVLIDADFLDRSFQPASELSQHMGLIWFLEHEDEEVVGISHAGHRGQWLGVRLDERIVGARLIADSEAYNPETDPFPEFIELLGNLAEER
ncbi:beta-lactamase family protein [Wenzhouxiangella sp. AB-CW3]|uniref:serine hydrolase domain-containing protein n=1 Tax=Wenzhouxiangella sp. AB-CW3 TaxID=2771012 RepID=UPI00168BEB96|nr:serine hydrolase domain-containing protein [Wenzhouxiangella sp. AB-CW3]QOC23231.1 beta-lactamase family protein [Wenzhouxiangella sp. AB-CW3]